MLIHDWNAKVGDKAESKSSEKLVQGSEMKQEIGLWISTKPTTCPSQTHASNNITDNYIHGHNQVINIEIKWTT